MLEEEKKELLPALIRGKLKKRGAEYQPIYTQFRKKSPSITCFNKNSVK
jgi:hypothetical protein